MKKFLTILVAIMMIGAFSTSAMALRSRGGSDGQTATATAGASTEVVNNPVTNSSAVSGGNSFGDNNIEVNLNMPEQKDVSRSIVDSEVTNHGVGYRGFANPAEIPMAPQGPAYFGNATPGELFQSLKTILIYKDIFSADDIANMEKSSDCKIIPTAILPAPENKDDLAPNMTVYISKPDAPMTLVGYLTVRSDNRKTVSAKVMASALEMARKMGGSAIHVTAEGVKRELKSFGWGIGASYTRATINNDEQTGGVAAGGLGIAGGSAGYVDFPWLQIFVLK